jgi:hypothetical protein
MKKIVDSPSSSGFKLTLYHNDYLFWIYPLIILGLIIFAISRDKQNIEPPGLSGTGYDPDSSITKTTRADSLRLEEYHDSIPILFFTINK